MGARRGFNERGEEMTRVFCLKRDVGGGEGGGGLWLAPGGDKEDGS